MTKIDIIYESDLWSQAQIIWLIGKSAKKNQFDIYEYGKKTSKI